MEIADGASIVMAMVYDFVYGFLLQMCKSQPRAMLMLGENQWWQKVKAVTGLGKSCVTPYTYGTSIYFT